MREKAYYFPVEHTDKNPKRRVGKNGFLPESAYLSERTSSTERIKHFGRTALAGLIITSEALFFAGIKAPIWANEQFFLKNSNASLSEVYPSENDHTGADAMTLVMGGLGTRDSRPIAEALKPLNQLGSVYAIEEDSDGIGVDNIAKELIAEAEKTGKTRINLWGDSIGGSALAQVAAIIQASDTSIGVGMLVLDGTPNSFDALQPPQQGYLRLLQTLNNLVPNIADHPFTQLIVKATVSNENVLTYASSVRGSAVAAEVMQGTTIPAALQASQANFVINSNLDTSFHALNKVAIKQPTLVVFITPEDSTHDAVVNQVIAEKAVVNMLNNTSLPYTVVRANIASHADPTITQNGEAYRDSINNIIIPTLHTYDTEYQSRFDIPTAHTSPRTPQ